MGEAVSQLNFQQCRTFNSQNFVGIVQSLLFMYCWVDASDFFLPFFFFPFLFCFFVFFLLLFCGSVWRAYNANIYLQERACVFADKRQSLIHMHGGLKMHLSDHMVVFCSAPAARIRVEPNSVTLRIRDAPALRMFTALPLPSALPFTHTPTPLHLPPPLPPCLPSSAFF